jgi:hypothetical protein
VNYRIGREGRAEHQEKLAGVVFFDHWYYRQEFLPQSTGEPSPYIQANCFRLTLSDSADRVRFSKPAGYDDLYNHYAAFGINGVVLNRYAVAATLLSG